MFSRPTQIEKTTARIENKSGDYAIVVSEEPRETVTITQEEVEILLAQEFPSARKPRAERETAFRSTERPCRLP